MNLELNAKGKLIAGVLIAVIIVIIIAIVLGVDNKKEIPKEEVTEQVSMSSDVEELDSLIRDVNLSKIEIISNKNNEQADVILDSIGIDIKNLISYAGSIDPKQESLHSILIVRPKEENYDTVRRNITDYMAGKQQHFMATSSLEDETKEYKTAKESLLYETDGYIVLVMGEQSVETMDKIREGLAEIQLQMKAEQNKTSSESKSN